MEMGMDVIERLFEVDEPSTIIIAAGDSDFKGMISRALKKGWKVEVWFWGNAAADMKAAADFVDLDTAFDYLRKGGKVPFPPESYSKQ